MNKLSTCVVAVVTVAMLLTSAACSKKKSNDIAIADGHYGFTKPDGVVLSCRVLFNTHDCQNFSLTPRAFSKDGEMTVKACVGETEKTDLMVVAATHNTDPGIKPFDPQDDSSTPQEFLADWSACKGIKPDAARHVDVDGVPATEFDMKTVLGTAKGRVMIDNDYSVMVLALPKALGENKDEIAAFTSSLHQLAVKSGK
ncbi:MAG TPA: hypothetical protein VNW52_01420 [Burkholderiaceae bacterium]|nr:hypothetical protein [Burkholderiaceae bacterium]